MKTALYWFIPAIALIGATIWWQVVSAVEQPFYQVVQSIGDIEIRDYPPLIVAETEVTGTRKAAINAGFREIADYIFGNNAPNSKVAMTAPVIQQPSAKIAMTAPVTQQLAGDSWTVRFIMPSGYTMETLPRPGNAAVKLMEIPARRFAVIRFSGLAGEGSLADHTARLKAFIKTGTFTALASPTFAFYNPPWTLPFLRRNEVMIEIAK